MSFKPVTHKVTIEDNGEEMDIYVREASGEEVLVAVGEAKKDAKPLDQGKDLMMRYLVNADGSAITKDQCNEYMSFRFNVVRKITTAINDKIGVNADPAKKD